MQQQDLWHQYLPPPSTRRRRLSHSSDSSTAAPAPSRPSLCPLSFALYDYDVEKYVLEHFETFSRVTDPDFPLKASWREDAARKANIALDVRRASSADSIEREGIKIAEVG